MTGRDWIDAKFEVVGAPKRRWRLRFDWRNFAVLAVVIIGSAVRALWLGH